MQAIFYFIYFVASWVHFGQKFGVSDYLFFFSRLFTLFRASFGHSNFFCGLVEFFCLLILRSIAFMVFFLLHYLGFDDPFF